MKKEWSQLLSNKTVQLFVFLFINSLYILKYVPRIGISPYPFFLIYIVLILALVFLYNKYIKLVPENTFKTLYWLLLVFALVAIVGVLIVVDPLTVRVDRWSALTYFWDSLLQGQYPYSAHTHVGPNNFASPFPLWHVINLPFYLLGDVGIELLFFLIIIAIAIKKFFSSYRISFFFMLLLLISPAYWWEISVRSDSLSNGLLVFMIILWYIKNNRTFSNSFKLTILLCGIIASTRMSALLPLAIFFFQPYLQLSTKQKIIFPLSVLGIAFLVLSPFIFWDTDTWIFFSRNPFMSQGYNGSVYIFLIMIPIAIFMALRWKNTQQFFNNASLFIFIFILSSLIFRVIKAGEGNLFSDGISDISYFNLALPYCLAFLTSKIKLE